MLDSWAKKKVQILLIPTPSIRPTGLFISASLHVLSSKLFPIVWRHTTNLHWFFLLVFHRNPTYFLSVLILASERAVVEVKLGILGFSALISFVLTLRETLKATLIFFISNSFKVTVLNFIKWLSNSSTGRFLATLQISNW